MIADSRARGACHTARPLGSKRKLHDRVLLEKIRSRLTVVSGVRRSLEDSAVDMATGEDSRARKVGVAGREDERDDERSPAAGCASSRHCYRVYYFVEMVSYLKKGLA